MAKHDKAKRATRRATKLAMALRGAMLAEIKALERLSLEADETGDGTQSRGFRIQASMLRMSKTRNVFATVPLYAGERASVNTWRGVEPVKQRGRLLTTAEAADIRASLGW